jgi:hypothetical protein
MASTDHSGPRNIRGPVSLPEFTGTEKRSTSKTLITQLCRVETAQSRLFSNRAGDGKQRIFLNINAFSSLRGRWHEVCNTTADSPMLDFGDRHVPAESRVDRL